MLPLHHSPACSRPLCPCTGQLDDWDSGQNRGPSWLGTQSGPAPGSKLRGLVGASLLLPAPAQLRAAGPGWGRPGPSLGSAGGAAPGRSPALLGHVWVLPTHSAQALWEQPGPVWGWWIRSVFRGFLSLTCPFRAELPVHWVTGGGAAVQQGGTHTCRWQPGKCPQVRSALRPAGVWEVSPGSGSPCRPGVGGSQHQRTFQRHRQGL